MRKHTKIRAWASAVLTAAMITTMGGMTAFAEVTPVTSVDFTKEISASPSNIQAPNASFTFEVGPVSADTTVKGDKGETIVVYKGIAGGATFAEGKDTITFVPGDVLSKTTTISFNTENYERPGVYRYQVTEKSGSYDGMSYSSDVFYLDLYVESAAAGGYQIVACKVYKNNEGKKDDKDFKFTNTYTTHDLSLTKKVTGNQADMNKKFDFTITVTGQAGEKFATDYTDAQGNLVILETGQSQKVSLGNEETIKIFGLSESDSYEIVEAPYAADGYKTKIEGADEGNGVELVENLKATGNVANGDDNVIYTNDKTVTTPTGIVLSFAPYIVLVALAGVFAVLFLRKKREEF